MRTLTAAHKLASRGEKCVMVCIARNYPSGTVKIRRMRTGQIVYRQEVSWHPKTSEPKKAATFA